MTTRSHTTQTGPGLRSTAPADSRKIQGSCAGLTALVTPKANERESSYATTKAGSTQGTTPMTTCFTGPGFSDTHEAAAAGFPAQLRFADPLTTQLHALLVFRHGCHAQEGRHPFQQEVLEADGHWMIVRTGVMRVKDEHGEDYRQRWWPSLLSDTRLWTERIRVYGSP